MRYLKLVFAVSLLVAVLAFVAGNTTPITLRFLIWETPSISLSLVVAGFFLLGILFTLLLGLLMRMRRGAHARSHTKPVTVAEEPRDKPFDSETTLPGKDDLKR